jgi:hypothetical protein
VRQGKDDVKVRHGQEVALACLSPFEAPSTAALGAVTISTRVVGNDDLIVTVTTLERVTAQSGGATRDDVIEDAPMCGRYELGMGLDKP